ncbi:hypothetical protein ACPFST_004778 [Escherichia coli]
MSTRNIHVNTASYTLLVAGKKKNTGEEWDVLEFSSLTELKKYRKSHPEKMAFSYSYALSRGVDTGFEGQWNENVRLWYNLLIIIQYTKVPFQGPFRML